MYCRWDRTYRTTGGQTLSIHSRYRVVCFNCYADRAHRGLLIRGKVIIVPTVHWRKGLSKATNRERLVLIEAEQRARERAFADAYNDRLTETNSLLCDANDLAVRSSTVEWARHKRCLYLRITVYHRSTGRIRAFNWRVAMPNAKRVSVDGILKRV